MVGLITCRYLFRTLTTRVTLVRKKFKVTLLVLSVLVIFALSFQAVTSNSDYDSECSTCHTSTGSISITPSTTSVEVMIGESFDIHFDVTGDTNEVSFLCKFPGAVQNNALFTYAGLDDEGSVNDGDAADLDTADHSMSIDYTITAPAIPDTYTLKFYATEDDGRANSVSITVTVTAPAGLPVITSLTATPEIPLANEAMVINATIDSETDLDRVILMYSIDNGSTWEENVTMDNISGNLYQGEIPGQPHGTLLVYQVVAVTVDDTENTPIPVSLQVGNIPVEPIEIPQLHYGWYLGLPALVLAYVGTSLEYYDEERFTKEHGIMLSLAYILTSINVLFLLLEGPATWNAMAPANLFQIESIRLFIHSWHIWLGIISMILGTLAFLTHIAGWKTCNLGLPAVVLWTILGFTGMYLGMFFGM